MTTTGVDQRKPKSTRSPYVYFLKEYQPALKIKNKDLSFGDASKFCAAKWKHMSEEVKTKYRKMSEKDRERYKREIQKLSPRALRMLKRRKKDLRAPVKPLTAYLWFCKMNWEKARRNVSTKTSYRDVLKELGKQWANCPQETRERFEALADCDRRCYELEMRRYMAKKLKEKKS